MGKVKEWGGVKGGWGKALFLGKKKMKQFSTVIISNRDLG